MEPGTEVGDARDEPTDVVVEGVRRLVADLRPQVPVDVIRLDSRLDADLGLDSLAVIELVARLADDLGVAVPDALLASADTLRDLIGGAGVLAALSVRPGPSSILQPEVGAPTGAATLVEGLRWHVAQHADRTHLRIIGELGELEHVTYGQLLEEATAVASALRQRGVGPGSSVAIMLPTGRAYFTTFVGALLAGGVPVPVYPPARPAQLEEHLQRHVRILSNAEAVVLVTVPEARRLTRLVAAQIPTLRVIASPEELRADDTGRASGRPIRPDPSDVALLQYTSGSTGDPKGVVLTHANLVANIRAMGAAGALNSTDVFVSWLPLYHDMGLIGSWLSSLWFGIPLVVMSPLQFLARPARWLQAIHEHGGTLSGGPNFGFELCLRRIEDAELDGVDLSSWRIAFNGAEPVSPDTVARFVERFAPSGFRAGALTPVYGLAECSVALAIPPLDRGPRIDRVARGPLAEEGRAVPAADDDPNPVRLLACGHPVPGHRIRVVDDRGRALPDRQEGLIQFQGPSATSGYHRNPAATRQLLDGSWRRTGDLGYLADGEVFITGRRKDLIIRAGRNLHPAELEAAVGQLPGVRRGCVAAFASADARTGTERLVVVAETRQDDATARQRIRDAIVETAVDLIGTPPDEVVVVAPGSVSKTSSGKIRRAATRALYESGTLDAGQVAVWRQVTRLGRQSALPQVRRGARSFAGLAYGIRGWLVFVVLAAPTWALVMLTPGRSRRWRLVTAAGRVLIRLAGIPVSIEGVDALPARGPYVVVANHASYADALMLMLTLPGPAVFAGVAGLARHPIAGPFVRRMGAHTVGTGDRRRDADAVHLFGDAVRAGQVVVFFPEGRRTPVPGLEPFRMGAFVVAADTGVPVVPITILGTRQLLPTHRTLPRRSDLRVVIGAPIRPEGSGWSAATRLEHAARTAILRHLGEPDLT